MNGAVEQINGTGTRGILAGPVPRGSHNTTRTEAEWDHCRRTTTALKKFRLEPTFFFTRYLLPFSIRRAEEDSVPTIDTFAEALLGRLYAYCGAMVAREASQKDPHEQT